MTKKKVSELEGDELSTWVAKAEVANGVDEKIIRNRKRMIAVVKSLQNYMNTYDKQEGYVNYTDKTFIDDVLYGLGLALDKRAYEGAQGYDAFKLQLLKHLNKE